MPEIPYGWQRCGETVALPSGRCKRLNILGFMNRKNNLYYETVDGWVNSDRVIACFDNFAKELKKETVVVVDNASIHTSKKFRARQTKWKSQGLIIFYLPTYSPELNLIEILWRFLKYHWLPLSAYTNRQALKENVLSVLDSVGEKHTITFA